MREKFLRLCSTYKIFSPREKQNSRDFSLMYKSAHDDFLSPDITFSRILVVVMYIVSEFLLMLFLRMKLLDNVRFCSWATGKSMKNYFRMKFDGKNPGK